MQCILIAKNLVSFQRNSISPAEREKYSRPRSTPDSQHHDHLHLKKMKKEQDKDIGHVSANIMNKPLRRD